MFKYSSSKVIGVGEPQLIPGLTSNSIIWTHTLKITFASNKASYREPPKLLTKIGPYYAQVPYTLKGFPMS